MRWDTRHGSGSCQPSPSASAMTKACQRHSHAPADSPDTAPAAAAAVSEVAGCCSICMYNLEHVVTPCCLCMYIVACSLCDTDHVIWGGRRTVGKGLLLSVFSRELCVNNMQRNITDVLWHCGEFRRNAEKFRETATVIIWLEGNSEKTFKLNQLSIKFLPLQSCSRYAVFLSISPQFHPWGNGAHAGREHQETVMGSASP
jgi:hypothetical protein